jgi:predicted metal-binding membrane protein
MSTAGEARATVPAELRAIDRRVPFGALVVCLAAAAWLTLWAWSASPYARYLGHESWTDLAVVGPLCSAFPGGEILVPALAYATGWLLMIAAMMLPTTLPLLEIFRRITAGRADASRLVALVALGYACAWLGFGLIAHTADAMVHAVVARIGWLAVNGWAIGAAVLGAAGLFQFTELKYRCLERCRTPLGFVVGRWRGGSPAREAFTLGVSHGLFCVGCCWALMLLTFAVGSGSMGWMLALSAIMAVEKNHPAGRRISAPLGAALLLWSSLLVLLNAGALAR